MQILQGKVLYRDFFYEYGLFPPYFLAFIFKVFGIHINSLVGCGIGITILMSILLYKISRFFLDEIVSGLVVVTFLFVFAFSHYHYAGIFNFILPYSFASIFYILFVSSALYFFLRFIHLEKGRYLLLWSICLSFAFFSRVEMSFLVWAGFVFTGGIFTLKRRDEKRWAWGLFLFLPFFIALLGYLLFLFKMHAFAGFNESIVAHILVLRNDVFNKAVMGLDNISNNILLMFKSFLLHLIIVFSLWIGSLSISSFLLDKEKSYLSLILGALTIFFIFVFATNYMTWHIQYRCLPLILIIGALISFIKSFCCDELKKNISLSVLFLVSLLVFTRLFLRTMPAGYGFYLLDLGLVGYYIFFFEIFKGFLRKHFKYFSQPLFSSILICFFLFLTFSPWRVSSYAYNHKNLRVETDRGDIFCWSDSRTKKFWETVDYLSKNTYKDDKVVVVPGGIGINFFSHRENPLGHIYFIPPTFKYIGEEKLVSMFAEYDIDYIVVISWVTLEYGDAFFGIHYGKKLYSWILDNYQLIKLIGPYPFTSSDFGVAIFRRNKLGE